MENLLFSVVPILKHITGYIGISEELVLMAKQDLLFLVIIMEALN